MMVLRKRKIVKGGAHCSMSSGSPKRGKFRASEEDVTFNEDTLSETEGGGGEDVETVGDANTITIGKRKELHPLLNEVILANIFKNLEPDELPIPRLVCRTWRDVTLSKWRSSAVIMLQYSKLDRRVHLNDGTSLGEFLDSCDGVDGDYHKNCKSKLFQKFHLVRWEFWRSKILDVNIPRFWNHVGGHITNLILDQCISTKTNGAFRVMRESCPNLETLTLQDFTRTPSRGPIRMKQEPHANLKSLHISTITDCILSAGMLLTYYEVLSNFPNLTYVKLESDWQEKEILDFCDAVEMIRRKEPGNLPIKLLGTREPIEIEIEGEAFTTKRMMMDRLKQLRIPLETISLEDGMTSNDDYFKELLQFHGRTLTKLFYIGNSHRPQLNFPYGIQLGQLRVLEITCVIKNLDFLKCTPNLEKLRIYDEPRLISASSRMTPAALLSNTSKLEMASLKLVNLTSLRILLAKNVKEDDLRFLAKCTPNLRNLKMFLDDKLFAIVCENWPNLVKLEVFGNRLTDKGVNGMKFRRISHETADADGTHAIQPNITFLQKLEVFDASTTRLTNWAFARGFLNLSNLRIINVSNDSLIGAKVRKTLKDRNIKLRLIDCWNQERSP